MWNISNVTVVRCALFCAALFGGLVVSPYAALLPMLLLALFWRSFEVLVLALFLDFMWLPPHHVPFFLIGSIILVWILEPIRNEFIT